MIEVLHPGRYSSVQDQGRSGHAHLGVPAAGAADGFYLRVANRLVGNPDGAAALEMTAQGPTLRFMADVYVALTGCRLEAQLDGQPLPMYQTLAIKAGSVLDCGPVIQGWRSYLAVAGGIDAMPVLGSRSRDTLSHLGPEPLVVGGRLGAGSAPAEKPAFYLRTPPQYRQSTRLRMIAGPHQDWFTPVALQALREGDYKVQAQSDRIGIRLDGPALMRAREGELLSMGMITGAIQVPPSGRPIVLLADHGATGGYPVIAAVISADLPLLAQLAPGAEVSFMDVTHSEALAALEDQETRLERDIVSADTGLLAARALMVLAGDHASLKQADITDGERRIRIRK